MGLEEGIDEPVGAPPLLARKKHGAVQVDHHEIRLGGNSGPCAGWFTVTLNTKERCKAADQQIGSARSAAEGRRRRHSEAAAEVGQQLDQLQNGYCLAPAASEWSQTSWGRRSHDRNPDQT
jgi:hypothetical protein